MMEDYDEIEILLRGLIEEHVAEESKRAAAFKWLERRARTYLAVVKLGIVDENEA